MESKQQTRVAIVGSGMAGLVTAYLLQRDPRHRYAVKVFESGNSLSLDSASVSLPNASHTSTARIDLPMRAFAGGFYSNLKGMYDHLGVKYHSQPFLFEFARVQPELVGRSGSCDTSHFIHASNLHKTPPPRPRGMATVSYLAELVYLLACYAWFSLCCFVLPPKTVSQGSRGRLSETLDHYLKRIWLPQYFVTFYLLPLISSVTTCPHQALLAFPASDLVDYKRRTHRAPHYTVSNGVNTVQDKLADGVQYELSAAVTMVQPQGDQVRICWKADKSGDAVREEMFDRVILAVAPDVVGRIFEPVRRHMERIPTMVVESVLHTDQSVVRFENSPDTNSADGQAEWIYLRTATDGTAETESHHVQTCGAIVTNCPFSQIDPSLTTHSAKFTRVLRSPESRRIVNGIFGNTPASHDDEKALPAWTSGDDNVWLVGGWCWDGMVLLEGCVVSAMRVADAFNVDVPWRR